MEDEILFEEKGGVGIITLNRPKALNALTLGMIRAMDPKLKEWETDESIHMVLIKGAGEKAFCAGGDVRAVWEAGHNGDDLTDAFFREEYILNRRIHRFPKPYVALLDGVTMGGGVGLSVHGSHRVVTDTTLFAMPETAIGLFPDVGGSWFLNKCPGESGMYLALTGARLKAADCIAVNMATDYVLSEKMDALLDAFISADWSHPYPETLVNEIIAKFATEAGDAPIRNDFAVIDACFAKESVEDIWAALEEEGGEFAQMALKFMRKKSPLSMKMSLKQLREGKKLTFEDCMIMEFRLSQACVTGTEFYEGVRSVLVDKDHAPKWVPETLEEVTDEMVDSAFESLGKRDLEFSH
ncbi:enoyl-CoA hydratase/isomerase family protein [Curvivirga sp.]|uniref:enoyl-CoA hydratase/isomerase family protein n=1 Tax=Curvivirga sp. TaxID=2856848 RepID=UPI003B5C82BA